MNIDDDESNSDAQSDSEYDSDDYYTETESSTSSSLRSRSSVSTYMSSHSMASASSGRSIQRYFKFEKVRYANAAIVPSKRSGHRAVCNEESMWIWGGYCPIEQPVEDNNNPPFPLFRELWKFDFLTKEWSLLNTTGDGPEKTLASHAMLLNGNNLLCYGGTSFPFGTSLDNNLYICNLKTLVWKKLKITGEVPEPSYGSSICLHDNYLYIMFGTNSHEYFSNVYKVDVKTLESECLLDSIRLTETTNIREREALNTMYPNGFLQGRYRQEIIVHKDKIYVFGGGDREGDSSSLDILPVFDLQEKKWLFVRTLPDAKTQTHPQKRKFHSCIKPDDDPFAYIFGGFYFDFETEMSACVENCVWRLDLDQLAWEKLDIKMPIHTYFHAACYNQRTGQCYFHGGVIFSKNQQIRTNKMLSIRLKVPALSELCWEKLHHIYSKRPDTLRTLGLPDNFLSRLRP